MTSARPPASSESVRTRMSRQRRRDTEAELRVRGILHARGIRFRVDTKPEPDLRVKGDIVWRGMHLIVFIDGCFWHGCPKHATWPKQNAEFWRQKIEANRLRDTDTNSRLLESGWTVLRFWEHESPIEATDTVAQAVAIAKTKRCTSSAGAHKKN